MSLKRVVELIHNSSERMLVALDLKRDRIWWAYLQREALIHFRRTLSLLWYVIRRKDNGGG